MIEVKYLKLKKQYEASSQPPSDQFLCKVPPTGEVHFGIKSERPIYGTYTAEQNGYKRAIERTPVPLPKVCDKCGGLI